MNCKQGDLAYVVGTVKSVQNAADRFCAVLYAAPLDTIITLPGGNTTSTYHRACWVVEFQRPVEVFSPKINGQILATYACVADFVLRPIRDSGDDLNEEWFIAAPKELQPESA